MKPIYSKINIVAAFCSLVVMPFCACRKLVEVEAPITSTNAEIIFKDNTTAAAVLTGIYADVAKLPFNSTHINSISLFTGLSADEFKLFGENGTFYFSFYTNNLLPTSVEGHFWNSIYPLVYRVNVAIEELNQTQSLNPIVKQHLLGECKFMRAYCYFNLVNMYGDVPLVLTSDYKVNSTIGRSTRDVVYQQIITDLIDSESLLPKNYLAANVMTSTNERIRPNKYAATALLARTYLYTKDYKNAEIKATSIIDQSSLYKLEPINDVFLKDSKEAIWQLANVGTGVLSNSPEGRVFVLPDGGPGPGFPVYLQPGFSQKFDVRDLRQSNWINEKTVNGNSYLYPSKYKIGQENLPTLEYSVKFRLAEQYLIRAESRINLNDIANGLTDLNEIRRRATNVNVPVSDRFPQLSLALNKEAALMAVEDERIFELFSEGHRWFDIKRTNRADEILKPVKGGNWQSTDKLYPIPQTEINRNPGLKGHQNPNY
ncbi:RagB/SusD family nutrient uptake outer membrane protein [Pedobacter sp. PWIIR3]